MSGICGIINFDGEPVDPDLLTRMTEASAFRGPHGIHYWIDGNVGFAHLALNTTPESLREHQPLHSRDGTICLTADARVDNRKELIRTLTSSGHLPDNDATDADLILAAYRRWGEECADHIIGDFAFAIWDATRQKLFCAHDAFGIRPFHYNLDGPTFRFGSDVRQILADEQVSRDLDGYAISDFLTSNFRDQARTMFASVQKLLPGHCLVLDEHGPRGLRYWNPDRNPPIRYSTDKEYVEHFRELFFRCVADRMRSVDGAVAIMTSGGVDSSSIAAVAQHLHVQGQVETRPVAYHETFDTLKECDEREYSLTLPAETGIEFHQIDAEQFCPFEDALTHVPVLDNPAFSYDGLASYVRQEARRWSCNVIMKGFGGDVLFEAAKWQYYDNVRTGRWWKLWPWIVAGRQQGLSWPRLIRAIVLNPLLPNCVRYYIDRWRQRKQFFHVPNWLHPNLGDRANSAKRLYQTDYPRRYHSGVRQIQYEQIIGLGPLIVVIEQENVWAAEHSLDVSFPFYDRRLADFVLASPMHLGARPGPENTKWILRQAMNGILPEKIRHRSNKTSWDMYIAYMLRNRIRYRVNKLFLHNARTTQHQVVDNKILLTEFDSYCNNTGHYESGNPFLPPIAMEWWLRTHFPKITAFRFESLRDWQSE